MTSNHITGHSSPPRAFTRWLQIVGVFYVLQFVAMAFVRAPIRTFGPEGALDLADAGDPIASFLVDTWVTFGLEVGAIGIAMLIASRHPHQARGVAWTVLAVELVRGIANDVYMIARDINVTGYLIWIAIHSIAIATGLLALRATATSHDTATATPAADVPSRAIA